MLMTNMRCNIVSAYEVSRLVKTPILIDIFVRQSIRLCIIMETILV